jgi:hypothetical protein
MATLQTRLDRIETLECETAWRRICKLFRSVPIEMVVAIAAGDRPAQFASTIEGIEALFTPAVCDFAERRQPPGAPGLWTDAQLVRFLS